MARISEPRDHFALRHTKPPTEAERCALCRLGRSGARSWSLLRDAFLFLFLFGMPADRRGVLSIRRIRLGRAAVVGVAIERVAGLLVENVRLFPPLCAGGRTNGVHTFVFS